MDSELRSRLREAGVDPDEITDPSTAYEALFETFGERATLLDRYQLEEHCREVSIDELSREERADLWMEVAALRYPEAELIGTSTYEPIEVTSYDPDWPLIYEQWRNQLKRALGNAVASIHHIGSTSVPGLAAKPVIDILVCMKDIEDEANYVEQIEALGVKLRSREPWHRYFRPPRGEPRTVHIHVCQERSAWERDHLAFRDLLRRHPEIARVYGDLKFRLAEQYRYDRLAYNEGKTAFVLDALGAQDASP